VACGLSYSGDGFLVASALCWSSVLLLPWEGEGEGGGKEACGIPGGDEEDVDQGREVHGGVDKGKRRWEEEEEGNSVGGQDPDGVPGGGASLGVAGDSDCWGPDDRAADANPFAFRKGGGIPPAPRQSSRSRGRQYWRVRIRSGRVI